MRIAGRRVAPVSTSRGEMMELELEVIVATLLEAADALERREPGRQADVLARWVREYVTSLTGECSCALPSQSCVMCRAAARAIAGKEIPY